jgi:NTP pyrophosphatase (non-canonical NTP hydrolase)
MSDSTTTIADLKERVRVFCESREWDVYHDAKDLAIGIITEASELLEHFRFKTETEAETLMNDRNARTLVSDEIADVTFFLIRLCQKYNFDLTTALNAKIEKNEIRYPVDKAKGSNKKYTELQ